MMEPAQYWTAENVTDGPSGTRYRRILIQGQVRAYLIVVFHVRQQDVTQMSFTQDDDVINAFPADRTDEPLSISVLPWGARRCWPIANAH